MATSLDLQEQEQLDALKAFWKQYGNLVTWVLILALGGFAAWNGWNWWQRDQGVKAGAMFDELDRAVAAGDAERAGRVFADLKEAFFPFDKNQRSAELKKMKSAMEYWVKQGPVVFYCQTGARSAQACAFMISRGREDVYNLRGGIMAWLRDGQPASAIESAI